MMAAGTNKPTSGESDLSHTVHTNLQVSDPEQEIDSLNNLLDRLEDCVDNLDQQATSLTDKIKDFLDESRDNPESNSDKS